MLRNEASVAQNLANQLLKYRGGGGASVDGTKMRCFQSHTPPPNLDFLPTVSFFCCCLFHDSARLIRPSCLESCYVSSSSRPLNSKMLRNNDLILSVDVSFWCGTSVRLVPELGTVQCCWTCQWRRRWTKKCSIKRKKRKEKQQLCHEINLSSLSHLRALCHRHHQAETQPGTGSASNKVLLYTP